MAGFAREAALRNEGKGNKGDGTAGDLLMQMLGQGSSGKGHSKHDASYGASAVGHYGSGKGSSWNGNYHGSYNSGYDNGYGSGHNGSYNGSYNGYHQAQAHGVPPPPMPGSASSMSSSAGSWHGNAKGGFTVPPPPPPPAANQGHSESDVLKDMLSKIAPQAKISENSSQLTSKASARILGKVLSSSGAPSAQDSVANSWDRRPVSGRPEPVDERGELPEWARDDSPMQQPGRQEGKKERKAGEEDDEDQFMARWNDMFSKGSPLVEGMDDPFKDIRRRKVVWKKRSGHHSRYQARRQQRESTDGDEAGRSRASSGNSEDSGAVTMVFDAFKDNPSGRED
eukprot:TRINITY_DN35726_c0_g1_i1.p1 TRINITY_DN35726_c0_g1~~TRINITY_DN35726_c0_g1_i1.p1  ORF type:complete len:340 (+),score=87.10 TRINITY_DN35726_c0_g1_i1:97-1116(+)